MAGFLYKGFVYEKGVLADLTIEGIPTPVEAEDAESVDDFARRYIDKVLLPGRERNRAKHLAILNQGVAAWNLWRRKKPIVRPTLADVDSHTSPRPISTIATSATRT